MHGGDASAYGSFDGTTTASHTGGDPNAQAHLNPQHTDSALANAYSPQQQGVVSNDAITPIPVAGPSAPPPAYHQATSSPPAVPDKAAEARAAPSTMDQPHQPQYEQASQPVPVTQPAPVAQKQPLPHDPMQPINGSNGGTVTPLHLLHGLQPYWIDCPYCKHRTMTRAAKEGSSMQYVASALLCLVCICCVCVPQLAGWFENINYYCTNCNKLVAMQPHDGPIQVYAPPEMTAVQSQYAGGQPGQRGQAQQQGQQQPHSPEYK